MVTRAGVTVVRARRQGRIARRLEMRARLPPRRIAHRRVVTAAPTMCGPTEAGAMLV
jgi:hypothetical protein